MTKQQDAATLRAAIDLARNPATATKYLHELQKRFKGFQSAVRQLEAAYVRVLDLNSALRAENKRLQERMDSGKDHTPS